MVSVRPDVVSSTPDDGWVSAVRAMFPTIRCYPKPAVLMPDPFLAARRPDWADRASRPRLADDGAGLRPALVRDR
jgi:hypothetical protein